jgi:glycosyltransferase involved in cell wall biosynthesis
MKRLLFIIESLAVGGAEKLLVNLLNELKGYELHLIVLSSPVPLAGQINPDVKVTLCNFKTNRQFITIPNFLRKYIRENKIDIVHSHLYWPNIYSRMATPRHVKLINHIHAINSLSAYTLSKKTLWLDKMTYRKRHEIVAVSKEVLDDFDKWVGLKGKSSYIYNNIDDKYFKPRPAKTFSESGLKLVMVGNLRTQKNYPYILEAFKKMPAGVTLDIYGEGYMREPMQKTIDENNLAVKLCGVLPNLDEILPTYDAFVMCSFYEGFSLGLMEAMASGLPALLSDIPVLREAGSDIALYFKLDDPGSAVERVKEILANKSMLKDMSDRGIKWAHKLASKEEFMRNTEALYS